MTGVHKRLQEYGLKPEETDFLAQEIQADFKCSKDAALESLLGLVLRAEKHGGMVKRYIWRGFNASLAYMDPDYAEYLDDMS